MVTKVSTDSSLFLESLLHNAFDFLEVAIKQFEEQPKYSVINFCSAVELFLKARLLKEHWSLVVAKDPNLDKFKKGDFQSVIFSKLIPQIKSVLNENISSSTEDCFQKLANHRNKIVHFYHPISIPNVAEEDLTEIVLEQHTAWECLKELFNNWSDIYAPYQPQIDNLDKLMEDYERKKYLQKRFDKIKDKIEKKKKQGHKFCTCESCDFPSNHESYKTNNLIQYHCWVCEKLENVLTVICPNEECGQEFILTENNIDSEYFKCLDCAEDFSKDYVKEFLCTNPVTTDNYNENTNINCANCMSADSVIEHEEFFVCLNCLSIAKNAPCCEWCDERQIGGGDLEDSYDCGCEFCDGHIGWHKDD